MAKRGPNEGSIFQRKDGRWSAQVNLGWQNGKRVRKLYYGATRAEVKEKLTRALADIQSGLPIASDKQTVAEFLGWWLDHVARPTVRPATWASYEGLVRLHLQPAFKHIPLSKITVQQIRALLNVKVSEGLSTRRVQYLHAVLRAALNCAVKDQLIQRNPAALVRAPRVTAKEVQPLSVEETRRFLETIKGDRLEALFTVAVSLGLRQGEALGLRWRDVDFESGTLRIRYALQRLKVAQDSNSLAEGGRFHLVEPKTKQSRRTIALPAVTLSALADHKCRQDEERKLAGSAWQVPELNCEGESVAVDDLVFVTRSGTPFDAPAITVRFQSLLKRAGIGHHRFHDLRHTAATLLAIQGVHPRAIQAALGWENMTMLNRYAHFVEEQRRAVSSAMDSILNPVAVNVAVKTTKSSAH